MTEQFPWREVSRSLHAHLQGLESWGIARVHGLPQLRSSLAPTETLDSGRNGDQIFYENSTFENTEKQQKNALDGFAELAKIASETRNCQQCRLCEERTNAVPGVGDPEAQLMFVGEAPGRDEDLRGEPFVGKAGQLLNKIIRALGFEREEVFIANTLKCRPPGNRDPQPDELAACTPFLERQVKAVSPRMIVALGRPAARFLTGQDQSMARMRGRRYLYLNTPVVATYHPAYLLRNPDAKVLCWQDLQVVVREFGRKPLSR